MYHNHSPVLLLAFSGYKGTRLQPVKEFGHIRIVGNHTFADLAADQAAASRTAQNAKHVVLGRRQIVPFQQLCLPAHERRGRPHYADVNLILPARERFHLPDFILNATHDGKKDSPFKDYRSSSFAADMKETVPTAWQRDRLHGVTSAEIGRAHV